MYYTVDNFLIISLLEKHQYPGRLNLPVLFKNFFIESPLSIKSWKMIADNNA